jgi:hypothetical protein
MAHGSFVGSAPDAVAHPMVLGRTRPMHISELGELTGPHRTPHVVRPMKSTGVSGVNLAERALKLTVEIMWWWLNADSHVDGRGAPDAGAAFDASAPERPVPPCFAQSVGNGSIWPLGYKYMGWLAMAEVEHLRGLCVHA